MVLYRLDQIPQRTYLNFFKLILDPPEPVTAEVIVNVIPLVSGSPITVPPGIRFATGLLSPIQVPAAVLAAAEGGWLIFETFETTVIPALPGGAPPIVSPPTFFSPPGVEPVTLRVRSRVVVEHEPLGTSNGQPEQIFPLKKGPVLLDDRHTGSGVGDYNPNPEVWVGHERWEYVSDFLDATGPDSRHFMVEQLTGNVRFGNGVKGRIPPRHAEIVAERYQILLGKEVKIGADMLQEIVNAEDMPGVIPIDIQGNEPAEGGNFIYPRAEVWTTGLGLFKETFRAITAADFEHIASTQFNLAQASDLVPETPENRVARAVAVPDKDLRGTPPFPEEAATMSVVILPFQRQQAPEVRLLPTAELLGKVRRFLQPRRLITTRVHVVAPDYVGVSLDIGVVREPGTEAQQVHSHIEARLRRLLHPLSGGEQDTGWPLGRHVYRSELFQQIEAVAGVDHVQHLVLNGDPARSRIDLVEHQLPVIEGLTLTV
jgi:predicted phage baseplate assembly protein